MRPGKSTYVVITSSSPHPHIILSQVFWIKLAQRLHRLRPQNESYAAEIERVLYNGVISQIPPVTGRGVNRVDPGAGRGGNWSRT